MGWDAGPAGKGEAGPGRATRDASLPQGPSRWTAPSARPTGTSKSAGSRGLLTPRQNPLPRPPAQSAVLGRSLEQDPRDGRR